MLLHQRSLQHAVTRWIGRLAKSRLWFIKQPFIHLFKRYYRVDLSEAVETNPSNYPTFHDFFTRPLKPGARPLPLDKNAIASPADGRIVTKGSVSDKQLLAKGHHYSLEALLGNQKEAQVFEKAEHITVYLAPKDYHRVHMPVDGKLISMRYIPGNLYPVNDEACAAVEGLFAKNERVICHFDTARGPMAIVLVGAMIVGSIVTPWQGTVKGTNGQITNWTYDDHLLSDLKQGDEMGYFTLGSTAIVLWADQTIDWNKNSDLDSSVEQGQALGHFVFTK